MRERQWLELQLQRGSLPSLNYTVGFRGRSNALLRKKVSITLISVEINGEAKQIPAGLNVLLLLQHLGIDTQRVAVELNRDIVRKAQWESTPIGADAKIEIVMFVGGGSR